MSKYQIVTSPDTSGFAPNGWTWMAYYDGMEDGLTGHGTTEEAAIVDLVTNHDLPVFA